MPQLRPLVLIALLPLLVSCGIDIPADRQSYIGRWESPNMRLSISSDGRVEYERKKGASTTSVSGPIQSFEGDSFTVGVLFIKTTFVVSKAPHREGDTWKMVVDGVELVRAE